MAAIPPSSSPNIFGILDKEEHPPAAIAPDNSALTPMKTSTLSAVPVEPLTATPNEAAWQTKYQPQGPCCEWPRWIGGDPAERWPSPIK